MADILFDTGDTGTQWYGSGSSGIRFGDLSAGGTSGNNPILNDGTLPDDAEAIVQIEWLTTPSAGTFYGNEDGSFTFSGAPAGTYTATYRLTSNMTVSPDTGTITLIVTDGNAVAVMPKLPLITLGKHSIGAIAQGAPQVVVLPKLPRVSLAKHAPVAQAIGNPATVALPKLPRINLAKHTLAGAKGAEVTLPKLPKVVLSKHSLTGAVNASAELAKLPTVKLSEGWLLSGDLFDAEVEMPRLPTADLQIHGVTPFATEPIDEPAGPYRNLQASVLRFIADFGALKGCTPINFDSSFDEAQLPRSDVCGILGLTIGVDDHMIQGSVQFGISTWDDTNLMRLTKMIDSMFKSLLPTKKLRIYDADTGDALGLMVITGETRVMPVAAGSTRPVQFVAVSFQTTLTYSLASQP